MAHEPQQLVSVVMPAYNRETTVGAAIESVLQQTHRELELLVVDDGSQDRTAHVIKGLAESDPRVKPIFFEANRGVCAARNAALEAVTGDFVAFLDSDDLWLPWKISAQLAVLKRHPDVGLCWTDMSAVDPQGELLSARYLRTMYTAYQRLEGHPVFSQRESVTVARADGGPDQAEVLLGDMYRWMWVGNLVHTSTVVVRRRDLDSELRFETEYEWGEDWPFFMAILRGTRGALLDTPTVMYQIGRDDQAIHPRNSLNIARANLATKTSEMERFGDLITLDPDLIATSLADSHAWLADALMNTDRRAARRHALKSLRIRPRFDERVKTLLKSLLTEKSEARLRDIARR